MDSPVKKKEMAMDYLLGVDAGGTKTLCVIASEQGKVVGIGRAGCGNYQLTGKAAAGFELARAIQKAIDDAGIARSQVTVAYYGISGADRDRDFENLQGILDPINPGKRMFIENDTMIALRAGTEDGIGLGLISGTGTNAVGINREGKRVQVGGWGSPFLGDYGSAYDIAASAVGLAQRGRDGRGKPTVLYEKLARALQVRTLIDICEWDHADTRKTLDIASYAPLVFEAAREGDEVALELLEFAGKQISLAAKAVLRQLFDSGEEVPVVLGGSVFQKGDHQGMILSLERELRNEFPRVRFLVLERDPVIGSLLAAADRLPGKAPRNLGELLQTTYLQRVDLVGAKRKKTE